MKRRTSVREFLSQIWQAPPQQEVEESCERVWKRIERELDKYDVSLRSLESVGWSPAATSQLEFQVLTAASALGDRAELKSVTRMVRGWTEIDQVGTYGVLCRLERRGLVNVRRTKPHWPPSAEPDIRYDVTKDGDRALRRARIEGKQLMVAQTEPIKGIVS
jgi:hypothetical protein